MACLCRCPQEEEEEDDKEGEQLKINHQVASGVRISLPFSSCFSVLSLILVACVM